MFGVKASNIIRPLCLKTSSQVYDVQPNLHAWEEAEGGLCVLEINCHSPGKTLSQKQTNKQTESHLHTPTHSSRDQKIAALHSEVKERAMDIDIDLSHI